MCATCRKFRGRKNRGEGEKGEGVGTFHVPGRLIKFQKLKHHLLRVFSRLVVGPEKSAERVATPSKGSNIFFIKRGYQASRAKSRPFGRWPATWGGPKNLSLSLPLSLSIFTNNFSMVVRISLVDHRRFNPRSDSPDRKTMRR